ncbi:hypothetical protein [Nonomuraea sp. PA05]|nr:hypothetical protein [Nonomuraea sp. PA05]
MNKAMNRHDVVGIVGPGCVGRSWNGPSHFNRAVRDQRGTVPAGERR